MYKNKKNGIAGTIITILILIVLVFITNIKVNNFSKIENVFNKIVMPFQDGLIHLKNKIAKNNGFFENIDNLKKENEELKKQNSELKSQLDEMQIIKAENGVLREYANLAEEYSEHETVAAYIINKDISNFSDNFIINVGTKNGVNANMAVIGPDGLIGYVISSSSNTSKVQPIINAASSVSGVMMASRENVIVKGQVASNRELKVTCLQANTQLLVGDIVETSGLGGIYPKGIKIGTIKEVVETKNVTQRYAILETATDFNNLEYVLVIKK